MSALPGRVLVIGATGAQGGSVVRQLLRVNRHSLNRTPYVVRALTRHPEGPVAAALARQGVEIVGGSLADSESLKTALAGCDLVFGVTDYWEHFEVEVEHGRNLVDAVAESEARHLVLSTLPSSRHLSDGAINVPHFETKALIERYARIRLDAVTFVHVAFYYENLLGWFRPQPQADGSLAFGFPQGATPLAAVSVQDVGTIVEAILHHPERFTGETLGIVGDDRPVAEYARTMSQVLGRRVTFNPVERDVFARSGFPGADDLAAMFDLNRRFIRGRRQDLAISRRLHPALMSFADWMALNRSGFAGEEASPASAWAA